MDPQRTPQELVQAALDAAEAARRSAAEAARSVGTARRLTVPTLFGVVLGSVLTFSLPLLYHRLKEGPTPIDQSPAQLLEWYKDFKNEAQAQALAERLYYGQYILAVGPITEIGRSSNSPKATVHLQGVVCFVDFTEAAKLTVGEPVTVVGRISAIVGQGSAIQLHNCRITSSGAPPSSTR